MSRLGRNPGRWAIAGSVDVCQGTVNMVRTTALAAALEAIYNLLHKYSVKERVVGQQQGGIHTVKGRVDESELKSRRSLPKTAAGIGRLTRAYFTLSARPPSVENVLLSSSQTLCIMYVYI